MSKRVIAASRLDHFLAAENIMLIDHSLFYFPEEAPATWILPVHLAQSPTMSTRRK